MVGLPLRAETCEGNGHSSPAPTCLQKICQTRCRWSCPAWVEVWWSRSAIHYWWTWSMIGAPRSLTARPQTQSAPGWSAAEAAGPPTYEPSVPPCCLRQKTNKA